MWLHAYVRSVAATAGFPGCCGALDVALPLDALQQDDGYLGPVLPAEVRGHLLDDVFAADTTAITDLVTSNRISFG